MEMYRYSPHPIDDYRLAGLHQDEVTAIQASERADAIWNLFWLSYPELDNIPSAGRNWHQGYRPRAGNIRAVVQDCFRDEILRRKVVMHPDVFLDWFTRAAHRKMRSYAQFGEARWPQVVIGRANDAALRLASTHRPVQIKGNVIQVNFQRAA